MSDSDKWKELPEALREPFEVLWQEVAWLWAKWVVYRELFGSEVNRALLDYSAAGAFKSMQLSMVTDMTMSVARLADPPETGKNENMSIDRFVRELDGHCSDEKRDALRKAFDAWHDHCEPFITRRNKIYAHIDKDTALSGAIGIDIPGPIVRKAMDDLHALMNDISEVFSAGEQAFTDPQMHGLAPELLGQLRKAKGIDDEERRKRLQGG